MSINKERMFFLVLGMHRSGTSCLTGVLERCGVYLGAVQGKGKYNKKGFFEIKELYQTHERILNNNNGSWYQPPHQPIEIQSKEEEHLKKILERFQDEKTCGLKDPRMILLLDIWKELLSEEFQLLGTFRHPLAVAASLQNRNQISVEQGIELWIQYNNKLMEEHQFQDFPIIHYDLSNKNKYYETINKLAYRFDLKPKKWKLRNFVSKKLEHHNYSNQNIPGECKEIYDYLISNKFQ